LKILSETERFSQLGTCPAFQIGQRTITADGSRITALTGRVTKMLTSLAFDTMLVRK
jgi:hypothetical protein